MSCLTLLHSSTQLLLHGHAESVWRSELAYAKSCLDVLDHCGSVDKVAFHFAEVARIYYTTLAAQATDIQDTGVDIPEGFEYLFTLPEGSSLELVHASQELLRLVASPFGHTSDLYSESILKTGLSPQITAKTFVTLPFNRPTQKPEDNMPLLGAALSSLRAGQFVGSLHPHRWDSILDVNKM